MFVINNDTVIELKRKLDEANKKLETANIIIHKNKKKSSKASTTIEKLDKEKIPVADLYMVFNDDRLS